MLNFSSLPFISFSLTLPLGYVLPRLLPPILHSYFWIFNYCAVDIYSLQNSFTSTICERFRSRIQITEPSFTLARTRSKRHITVDHLNVCSFAIEKTSFLHWFPLKTLRCVHTPSNNLIHEYKKLSSHNDENKNQTFRDIEKLSIIRAISITDIWQKLWWSLNWNSLLMWKLIYLCSNYVDQK